MPRVLLTAFKPYDRWPENASWLTVVELTKELPSEVDLTTRLYPVDFAEVRKLLESDLASGYDFALHLGQAPGAARLRLEAIGLNARCQAGDTQREEGLLEHEGPVAYRSPLPLTAWAAELRGKEIPAEVSYHAGLYLCNATLYWSLHFAQQQKLATRSAFLHVPLDITQAAREDPAMAALPAAVSAEGVRLLLRQMLLV